MPSQKTILGLAIGGAGASALSSMVFAFEALALPAFFAFGAGIFISISKDWKRLVPGIGAAVVGLLGVVGAFNLTIGESGFDAAGLNTHVVGLVVLANMLIASMPLWIQCKELRPWLAYGGGAIMGAASVIALVVGAGMDDHSGWAALVVGFLSLAAAAPSILLLRSD